MTLSNSQFANLYVQYFPALKSFALKLTKDPVKAEDLVQETALKAFKGKHSFKEGTNFKSWAFTILKNSFITAYHKNRKRACVDQPIEELNLSNTGFSVKNNAESNLHLEVVNNCVDSLSTKCKVPFEMHTEGFQYDEISEKLEIPMGTVKSRINYARTTLKKKLNRFA